MPIAQDWINAQRAESLARLIFAKIPDCAVSKVRPGEEPYDFLLSLLASSRQLAVEVKATRLAPHDYFALKYATGTLQKIKRLNIPLLLLLIDVVAENVYYGWIKRPIIAPASGNVGEVTTRPAVKKLSENQLNSLIRGIESTKELIIHHGGRSFRLYVSQHSNDVVHATVLYHDRVPSHSGKPTTLAFKHKNFQGGSENEVIAEAYAWLNQTFGPGHIAYEEAR
jgi:hypothetical protein